MCGIYFYNIFNRKITSDHKLIFNKIRHRGPDNSDLYYYYNNYKNEKNVVMGFHRLSINDTSPVGNQPFEIGNFVLICNGEIYNHRELVKKYSFSTKSYSDCEVILHLFSMYYKEYKDYKLALKSTLKELDGVFAFIIYDTETGITLAARDPIGIRPLFIRSTDDLLILSSEAKSNNNCSPFKPGHFCIQTRSDHVNYIKYESYKNLKFTNLTSYLADSVAKRIKNTERPIGCFLSGGLDSSLIAYLATLVKKDLRTFSIAFVKDQNEEITEKNCPDAYWAEKVAKLIRSNHTTVKVTLDTAIDALPRVIYHLESFDTTTVRASTAQFLLSKWINENTDIKVLLSGEGSDELFGGYEYFLKAPNKKAFDEECDRLINELYLFDVLRTDRTVSGNGLEIRVPFLDLSLIQFYKQIREKIRLDEWINDGLTKVILRELFERLICNSELQSIKEWKSIIYRRKEAFSDAVGYSWVDTIQEKIKNYKPRYTNYDYFNTTVLPRTNEEYYYRDIFIDHFEISNQSLIGKYWMPNWQNKDLVDPSARFLKL